MISKAEKEQRRRFEKFMRELRKLIKTHEQGDVYGVEVYPPYTDMEDRSFFAWDGEKFNDHKDHSKAI